MAFSYGFFNSHDGDRTYSAKQFGSIFDGIINDGVLRTIGRQFRTEASNGMKVKVGSGRGWFCHTWVLNTDYYTVTIPQSEVILDRIDAVVIEIDHREDFRRTRLAVVKGPSLTHGRYAWPPISDIKNSFSFLNTDEQKQIPIAYIRVVGKTETIVGDDIFSIVGKEQYGGPAYVTGPLKTVDASDVYSQIEASWINWFEHIQYELDGDVAGHLQRQIDEIKKFASIYVVDKVLFVPMSGASIVEKELIFATT